MNGQRILKKTGKVTAVVLLILAGLLLLLWLAIQQPRVQNKIKQELTEQLGRRLDTRFEIGDVRIRFFRSLLIEDFYLEDRQRDTLLAFGRLEGRLSLFSLLGREIDITFVGLEDAHAQLRRSPGDSTYNFQFLIDAFASEDTTAADTTTGGAPWRIGLGDLRVRNLNFRLRDSLAEQYADLHLGRLEMRPETFDLESRILHLNAIALSGIRGRYAARPDPAPDTSTTELRFPDPGWDLALGRLRLEETQLAYDQLGTARTPGRLDYNHLQLNDLSLLIEDFTWDADALRAGLRQLAFREQSGLTLTTLSADLLADDRQIAARDLRLSTPHSRLRHELLASFDRFADLSDFLQKVTLDLDLREGRLALQDLRLLLGDTLSVFDLTRSGELTWSGRISGPVAGLSIDTLRLALGKAFTLTARGRINGLPETERIFFDLPDLQLSTAYRPLLRYAPTLGLPGALDTLGRVRLRTSLQGRLNQLRADSLVLATQSGTRLEMGIAASNLLQTDSLYLAAAIRNLTTRAADWRGFTGGATPPPLDSLGRIHYSGQFAGFLTDFTSNGQIQTGAGELSYDLSMQFDPGFEDARYQGQLNVDGLALQKMLADTANFGPLSLETTFEGSGLREDSLELQLDSEVRSLLFRAYRYRNIRLQSRLTASSVASTINLEDPNLRLSLEGQFGWRDSLPALQVNGRIDTASLHALNLYGDSLFLATSLALDFSQLSAEYPVGELTLSNLHLRNATENFQTDRLHLEARQAESNRSRLRLQSGIGRAELEGRYRLSDLPQALAGFVHRHFSLAPVADPTGLDSILRDTRFDLTIALSHPDRLVRLFVPAALDLDTFYLDAGFDGARPGFSVDAVLPRASYGDIRVDSLRLSGREEGRFFLADLDIGYVRPGPDLPALYPRFSLRLGKDSLEGQFILDADTLGRLFGVDLLLRPRGRTHYRLTFKDPFIFSGSEWQVDPSHYLELGPGYLRADRLRFRRGEQAFYVQSRAAADTTSAPPLEIGFRDYQLDNLSRLVQLDSSFLTGTLNGFALVDQPDGSRLDLEFNQLQLNGREAGNLTLQVEPRPWENKLIVATRLTGPAGQLNVEGQYATNTQQVEVQADVVELAMPLIDALLPGIIRDSRGEIGGSFRVTGPVGRPSVTGSLVLDTVGTFVEYLQLRYRTEGRHTIAIDEQKIEVGELILRDAADRRAVLSGRVRHDHFENLSFELDFSTQAFPFLRTEPSDTSLFYGTVLLRTDASIRGTPDLPEVNVRATTLDSTRLYLQPLTEEEAITERDYIIYGTPPPPGADSTGRERSMPAFTSAAEIDLSLFLEVTPEAELQVIIDPTTGEKLTARGSANVSVEIDPAGNLRTTGTYELTEGSYLLNYEGLVKKSFRIQSGSRITLLGDPLDSRFDVTAIYSTRATPFGLLSQQANLTEAEQKAARRRIDVDVLLQISGTLEDLDLSFDIRVPEDADNDVADALRRRLNRLENDQNELNKQVFGLLLFDSFIAGQNSQASLAGTGESLALSSVSNLITSQLNQLADRYIRGVELDIGLESYKSDFAGGSGTVTELQVGLSKQLFDDRLSVQVGGNVDLESQQEDNAFTSFAGDFVLEYDLTEDGRYLLRVFSRYDYDLINGENVNQRGIGIMYRKAFGRSSGSRKKEDQNE